MLRRLCRNNIELFGKATCCRRLSLTVSLQLKGFRQRAEVGGESRRTNYDNLPPFISISFTLN